MDTRRVARIGKLLPSPTVEPGTLPLGNEADPIDELIFIILTTMTESGAPLVFARLKEHFLTWERLLDDPCREELRDMLQVLGLSNQKADAIVAIARKLAEDFGAVTLDPLRTMSDDEAEAYLLSLPRVGKKIARCVLMYSLQRDVLPVDAHVLRVAKRIGLLPSGISWIKAHDEIHAVVPKRWRFSYHVGLVIHGRGVCTARKPKCELCPLFRRRLCDWPTTTGIGSRDN